jgi:hypothetical protein
MSSKETLARLAADGNGVAIDPARLAAHAAVVAEMNARVSGCALAKLGLGDSPWSLQTFKAQESAAAKPGAAA